MKGAEVMGMHRSVTLPQMIPGLGDAAARERVMSRMLKKRPALLTVRHPGSDRFGVRPPSLRQPRISRGCWLAILAFAALAGSGVGCRSGQERASSASGGTAQGDRWKNHRSPTEGTDFNKVPPGQTISAPLGVDLP
jgi:hypothetical protein